MKLLELEYAGRNWYEPLIHTTSPTLVLHQLGWGLPHAMWCNHAYAFYLDSITNGNGNGNKKFSLAWTVIESDVNSLAAPAFPVV